MTDKCQSINKYILYGTLISNFYFLSSLDQETNLKLANKTQRISHTEKHAAY